MNMDYLKVQSNIYSYTLTSGKKRYRARIRKNNHYLSFTAGKLKDVRSWLVENN